jgi:ADP-ribosylglycohydrolase/agmatine/peptidylarginine deiminase
MANFSSINTLYFAGLLPATAPRLWQELTAILDEYRIPYQLLPLTNDIWAVDYMPVQVSRTEFVQFRYDPSYLKFKKYDHKRTDASQVMAALPLPTAIQSPLRLDGGNVVWAGEKAILTNRVFSENPAVSPTQLRAQLSEALRAELLIIPADPHDFTGHADGMMYALDERTVLINDYQRKEAALGQQLADVLNIAGLTCIPFPYFPQAGSYSSAVGVYINFVRVGPLVLLPVFDLPSDEAAVYQTERLFPNCKVVPLKVTELAPLGGLLHCVTWGVDQPGVPALPTGLPEPSGHSYYGGARLQYGENVLLPGRPLDPRDRYRGSLLGAAYGDALAAQSTPTGVPAQGTAVTQLMLFTAEGLLRAEHRGMQKGIMGTETQIVWESWLRWLSTQGIDRPGWHNSREWPSGWLSQQTVLQHARKPAPTTWQALTSSPAHPPQPAANTSMGADPLARVIPIGLFYFYSAARAMELAMEVTTYTHGHPVAQAAAGWVAATIALLVRGTSLEEAARVASHFLPLTTEAGEICRHAVRMALQLHAKPTLLLVADYRQRMMERTAPAALLGGLYYALQFQHKPETALVEAAQAGGRVTAALTGALLGASLGEAAWPTEWSSRLDLAELTLALADDLFIRVKGDSFNPDKEWWERYPGY